MNPIQYRLVGFRGDTASIGDKLQFQTTPHYKLFDIDAIVKTPSEDDVNILFSRFASDLRGVSDFDDFLELGEVDSKQACNAESGEMANVFFGKELVSGKSADEQRSVPVGAVVVGVVVVEEPANKGKR